MKKFLLLICAIVMMVSSISTVNATTEIDFTYQTDNYFYTIDNVSKRENETEAEITENGTEIILTIDENFRYVRVNNMIYTFDDFNKALEYQSTLIYDNDESITILEALTSFKQVEDLNEYLRNNKIDDLELNAISKSSISPLGYGTFYNVGTYNQDLLFSLAAGSVSLIFALATKGVSVLFITKENVKKFIKYILGYTVKTQFYSTTYVKREQAVLNSHGTTTEKRTLGAKLPGKSSITWDTSCYKFTFETQRPA
ncbi:MAG: hypothetical protein U0L85_08225 [Bacilli bacterium]|nr:hypothetical protein [Bacilli bacterium]